MALWVCADCTSRYSVGAAGCPQCGSTEYREDGAPLIDVTSLNQEPGTEWLPATPPLDSAKPVRAGAKGAK